MIAFVVLLFIGLNWCCDRHVRKLEIAIWKLEVLLDEAC